MSDASLWSQLAIMVSSPLMQRSLLAALLIGISAPVMGTYLVHRKLAMLGDGIGHVALTGVALGWFVGSALQLNPKDTLAFPFAVVVSIAGAVLIEVIRSRGKTSGDVALAMLFYGGIAGGVLLISLAGGTSAQLNSYLFGSIATVTWNDLWISGALTALVLLVGIGLRPALFSACNDADFATASGLPVNLLSILIAAASALTVSVSMRVVGALLVSALMIVPVAIAQIYVNSFKQTMHLAMFLGAAICLTGLTITYFYNLSPGATIVVLAIAIYGLSALGQALLLAVKKRNRLKENRAR
ncbi:ABC transporter [Boudabousia liubingyangii]|uniref:metal ABC transporter permease n=1 Tax=Boudabousia liubingyangii TaxID=1921764 RepID=UPI00093C161D|nr:metal ABC transporter permease [Boudabousia liubingyangii]OKL47471.1 ABC transporter [Boudabousia liubingyangii]